MRPGSPAAAAPDSWTCQLRLVDHLALDVEAQRPHGVQLLETIFMCVKRAPETLHACPRRRGSGRPSHGRRRRLLAGISRTDKTRPGQRRGLHRRVGQRGQRRRRRPRDGEVHPHRHAADPHSFEASPADAAEISDASLVVFNGGDYDHWVDEVLAANPDVPTVDGYSLLAPSQQPANEHVFYDLGTVKAVANSIAEKLAASDSAHAADYTANAAEFGDALDTLAAAQRAIGQAHPGASVVSTEPVAYYALRNAGIIDRTPQTFADAVEEGDDPSPADVAAVLDLINSRQVSAIVVNTQTETAATKQISDAARQASPADHLGHRDPSRRPGLPELAARDGRRDRGPTGSRAGGEQIIAPVPASHPRTPRRRLAQPAPPRLRRPRAVGRPRPGCPRRRVHRRARPQRHRQDIVAQGAARPAAAERRHRHRRGRPVTTGSDHIGYVPQHRSLDRGLSLRGSDLVALGYDGHRWGLAGGDAPPAAPNATSCGGHSPRSTARTSRTCRSA